MDYKVKLTKCQIEHYHGGVFDMWTKWAKPQAKLAQGPAGRPGFESTQHGIWLTRLYIGSEGRIRGLKAVEAERSDQPALWMADRLSICSKPTLLESVETPLCPYIRPPMAEDSTTHSTCSSPLVKILV
jgi:hypothetical protein